MLAKIKKPVVGIIGNIFNNIKSPLKIRAFFVIVKKQKNIKKNIKKVLTQY